MTPDAQPPDADLPDSVHRDAMDVVLTWGPERGRPEEVRLSERQPDLDATALATALQDAHRVLRRAEAMAPALKGTGHVADSVAAIRRDHPWLTDELWDRAASQGMYFDWRDSGR